MTKKGGIMTTEMILTAVILGLGFLIIGVLLMGIGVWVINRHDKGITPATGQDGSSFNR